MFFSPSVWSQEFRHFTEHTRNNIVIKLTVKDNTPDFGNIAIYVNTRPRHLVFSTGYYIKCSIKHVYFDKNTMAKKLESVHILHLYDYSW